MESEKRAVVMLSQKQRLGGRASEEVRKHLGLEGTHHARLYLNLNNLNAQRDHY